jgi:ethanolamine utilization protein EutJ
VNDAISKIHRILNHPECWDFSDSETLFAGVDIGTYKVCVVVVDEKGVPRAAAMRRAEVVRSGLIVDYIGALNIVREIVTEIRSSSSMPVEKGATSYPPNTESGNIDTTKYILEGVELDVLNVLDEPEAANLVLEIKNGAIVDVGGGTTGVAVICDGNVVYTADEATGGVHLTLALAGSLQITYEAAEKIKSDSKRNLEILSVVRPVIEKVSSIVSTCLHSYDEIDEICLVGGTCELNGLTEIVGKNLGLPTFRPEFPQVITPYGIALSCLDVNRIN